MPNQNIINLEEKLEKKYQKKDKRKQKKMKVSGAGVKRILKIKLDKKL